MTIVSTELLSYGNAYTDISDSEARTIFQIFIDQGFTEFTMRFPSWVFANYPTGESATRITNIKRLMAIAREFNLLVNLDLHTWSSTYINTSDLQNAYLGYVTGTINAMDDEPNLQAWMVMNEPMLDHVPSSAFIENVVNTAKTLTNKPVSVRFAAGHSPDQGDYAQAIDEACDFICRNTYWDPRYPSAPVYQVTEAIMENLMPYAQSLGKELWITEFGRNHDNNNDMVDYMTAFVAWFKARNVDRIYGWCCQPGYDSVEPYDLFNQLVPRPEFYTLVNDPVVPKYVTYNSTPVAVEALLNGFPLASGSSLEVGSVVNISVPKRVSN